MFKILIFRESSFTGSHDKSSLLLHCEQRTEEHDVGHLDMADVEMKAGLKASMT